MLSPTTRATSRPPLEAQRDRLRSAAPPSHVSALRRQLDGGCSQRSLLQPADTVAALGIAKGPESGPPLKESSSQPLFGSDPDHEALIDEWVALFNRKYGRTVSRREAREMSDRMVALFKLLSDWDNRAESPGNHSDV